MTGLIYVAIIAVWAVVLVPAWLRRHDHLDPERSVDRFARSMKTLGSRPSVLGIPMPSHEDQAQVDASAATEVVHRRRGLRRGAKASSTTGSGARHAQSSARTSAPRRLTAAARRRIVLGVLLTALLAVAALVLPGIFSPVALAVPAGLILGFLALASRQARVARRARSRAPKQRPARATDPTPSQAAPLTATATASTWEARATPLPTYVTAPPAAGYPRAIDQAPGAWTAAAMLERAQKQKDRAERMAAAKAEAIARARAEQEAAQVPTRDDEFLSAQATAAARHDTVPLRRVRAVNE